MTRSELKEIERQFGIRLPEKYRRFARLLPPSGEEDDSFRACFGDAAKIVQENRVLSEKGFDGTPWPPNLFCIGELDDNRYFIDLTDPARGVFYSDHEEGFDPVNPDRGAQETLDELSQVAKEAARENAPPSRWKTLAEPLFWSWWPWPRDEIRSLLVFEHAPDGGMGIRRCEAQGDVRVIAEQAIDLMLRRPVFLLEMFFEPGGPAAGGYPCVKIVGERGRFYLRLFNHEGEWQMFDPSVPDERVQLVEGYETYTYSRQNVWQDVDLLRQAVLTFVQRRRLLGSVKWVRLG